MISESKWKLALRNMLRNKGRTVFTGSAIAFGMFGILLAAGYVNRVREYMRVWSVYLNYTGHISIYAKDGLQKNLSNPLENSLTPETMEKLIQSSKRIPGVFEVSPFLLANGLLSNGERTVPFTAIGIDPAFQVWSQEHQLVKKWTPELSFPRSAHFVKPRGALTGAGGVLPGPSGHVVSLGSILASLVGKNNVQIVSSTFGGDFSALDANVNHVFTTGFSDLDATQMLAPLQTIQELVEFKGATFLSVFLNSWEQTDVVLQKITQIIEDNNLNASVYPWYNGELAPVLKGTLTFLYTMGIVIGFVLFGLVGLSVFNSMNLSVNERSKELGTLRAIGFTTRQLESLFLKECVLITLFFSIVGTVLAFVSAAGINALNLRFKPPGVSETMQFLVVITPEIVFLALCLLVFLSCVATFLACRKCLQKSIVSLLQSKGETA